jgi:hypothetical protein
MANPELDHIMILDADNFLSLHSPYLDFGWDGNPYVQDYINRIAPELAEEMEFRLGINERQDQYHIDIPLHPNMQILQDLAAPRQSEHVRIAQALRYAVPSPTTEDDEFRTDPESTETWEVTRSDCVVIGLIAASILYCLV